jgi:antitoxin MazE
MRVQVKKWGNSASVRIPASVMAATGLNIDQTVDVRADEGRIIIEPANRPEYRLEDLLAQMRPESFPDEIEFGAPAGQEIW